MNGSILDIIIIGAGHAGLSASYFAKHLGLEHIVFERGKIGESWRSQRWDSFVMNTSNRLNLLPGAIYKGKTPDGYSGASEFTASLEAYVSTFQLPVSENSKVISVEKSSTSPFFIVTVHHDNEGVTRYNCWQVVIASGSMNTKKIPSFANLISPEIKQLHISEYRNPQQLPEGAVLVTGSAQSGCQVAEDLLDAGKKVFLSTSRVPRFPRRYRGKDIIDWLIESKFMEVKYAEVTDEIRSLKAPLLSGNGEYGHTLSLQYMAQKGAILMGTMNDAEAENVYFQPNALDHIKFGDDSSTEIKSIIDDYIQRNQIQASENDFDEADLSSADASLATSITALNLQDNNITSILWATGFRGDFSYIKLPAFDDEGRPKHKNGISEVEGLYFLGFPWLRSRGSEFIFGIKDDAAFICNKVYSALR